MNKTEATQHAKKLVSLLGGKKKGWKIHLSENTGYYYCAEYKKGFLTVWPFHDLFNGKISYCAMLSDNYPHSCNPEWSNNESFDNPKEAIKYILKQANKKISKSLVIIRDAEKSI